MEKMPKWADVALIPALNLTLAFALSMAVIATIGQDPFEAVKLMITGALGSSYGWGYTLYYATNFIFTGLAVSIAFKAALFNIGGEGQAALGGLGVALVCLYIPFPHWSIAILFAILGGALFGALWAVIPAYLQAKRGSHVVITTIMFNFIAASLLNYVLVNLLRPKGAMDPASARFPEATHLPTFHDILSPLGIAFSKSAPVNVSFLIALIACVAVYLLLFRSRLGYEIRSFGQSQSASVYAGISPVKITMIAMLLSGGLAGMMSINNTMGESERLILNSVEGAGFIGIAVALMGRNHPFGVLLAALLFGFLYQGGGELALWMSIPRELVLVIQGLVILFTGALDNMIRIPVERAFIRAAKRKGA
ncbi:nucleoside ABC transporter membrane protein [Aliiroseovarius crassostreae]|uniref:Sugar ABC transporter permease n=1 Tax=Aliiroseovarius crassostreae TaxID=154981 RepID=A0A0P7JQC3_9RHOB|nr:ABC transporter permease [Aliiroseovarius crassostreae]KPN63566.1 sugar ABC transporter permease [Aliiroseovarius crassostreae]SFU84996.1 nucleoside ABC transporter membrane protein [Aliiroseovarius crassostreae]